MSDEKKLELAREIYPDSKRARKESFTPTQWAGVERAWEWIVDAYVARIKRHPSFQNLTDAGEEYMRGLAEQAASDFFTHAKTASPNDTTVFVVDLPKEPTVKQEPTIYGAPIIEDAHMPSGYGLVGVNMSAFEKPTPPWTEAQREAAERVRLAFYKNTVTDDGIGNACAAIAKVAHLFVSPPPVPSVVKVNRHYGDVGIDIEVIGSDGKAMHTEMVPWVEVDRCRLIGSVPSVEECERAYKEAWEDEMPHLHSSMVTRGESAGIAAVRALFVQGDGASVRGFDSHRAHPEGQPAPSPAPAPDREALANLMQLALAKHPNDAVAPLHDCRQDIIALRYRQADAAIAHFAPIVAALTRERDEARAECEKAMFSARLFCGAHVGVPQKSCPVCARDAALARVAEMEKERDEAYRVAGTAIGTDPVFFNAGCVAALADHAERLRSTNCEQRLHMARLVTERDALRKELAERCDQVDSLQHDRDKIMARLGNACQTYEIEDRIRALQGRVAALTRERDEARGKARSVTREELRKMEDAAVNNFGSWSDDLEAALRAVGIEVVG